MSLICKAVIRLEAEYNAELIAIITNLMLTEELTMSLREDALEYHRLGGKPGKISLLPTKPLSTQRDLSLAYSPGVAYPVLEVEKDPELAYEYTSKGNLVGVVSNGTAILGLGDRGALASKPVMEGKGVLFKVFSDIDVFDIEVNSKDPDEIIRVVAAIAPTFGGINLEDIKRQNVFTSKKSSKKCWIFRCFTTTNTELLSFPAPVCSTDSNWWERISQRSK